jgi:hypothetical protein
MNPEKNTKNTEEREITIKLKEEYFNLKKEETVI